MLYREIIAVCSEIHTSVLDERRLGLAETIAEETRGRSVFACCNCEHAHWMYFRFLFASLLLQHRCQTLSPGCTASGS
jgi:hypothetical protein